MQGAGRKILNTNHVYHHFRELVLVGLKQKLNPNVRPNWLYKGQIPKKIAVACFFAGVPVRVKKNCRGLAVLNPYRLFGVTLTGLTTASKLIPTLLVGYV